MTGPRTLGAKRAKTAKQTGRRTLLNADRQDTICEYLRQGATQNHAAQASGIHRDTYFDWLARGRDDEAQRIAQAEADGGDPLDLDTYPKTIHSAFVDAVEQAIGEGAMSNLLLIRRAAATPKNWTAAAWLLERGPLRDEYRRPGLEVTGAGGGPIAVDLTGAQAKQAVKDLLARSKPTEPEPTDGT